MQPSGLCAQAAVPVPSMVRFAFTHFRSKGQLQGRARQNPAGGERFGEWYHQANPDLGDGNKPFACQGDK